jgi:hypothetical protein
LRWNGETSEAGTHESAKSVLQGSDGLLLDVFVFGTAADAGKFCKGTSALGRHCRPECVRYEFRGVRVGLERGEVEVVAGSEGELGVTLGDGGVALFVLRFGGEGVGVVVGHGGSEREAWEIPTCENFHKSGAAAENLRRLCGRA